MPPEGWAGAASIFSTSILVKSNFLTLRRHSEQQSKTEFAPCSLFAVTLHTYTATVANHSEVAPQRVSTLRASPALSSSTFGLHLRSQWLELEVLSAFDSCLSIVVLRPEETFQQ